MGIKKIFQLLILTVFVASATQAQDLAIGVAAKGSALGAGADVVFRFHKRMDVRLGYDWLQLRQNVYTHEEQDVTLDIDVEFQNSMFSFMYDFYIANRFFVTAGFDVGQFEPSMHAFPVEDMPWGDITIPQEKIGDFSFILTPKSNFVPYLGLGIGQTLSKDKLVSFAFELGSYFQGSPDVEIIASGLMAPTASPINNQAEIFEGEMEKYSFYPVLKFSLGFKLWSNNNNLEL